MISGLKFSFSRSLHGVASRCEQALQRHYVTFVCVLLGLLLLNELWLFGLDFSQWDYLLISGVITFVVGLPLVLDIPQHVETTLTRLVNRGVLQLTAEELGIVKQDLAVRAEQWADRGGLIVSLAILLAFIVAFGQA